MLDRQAGRRLRGRGSELAALDGALETVRAGRSVVLVVHGEPGIGKTVLLEYLVGQAVGCRVVRAAGAESERELAFATLHQLCGPLMDSAGRLPGPQRDALATAFGLSAGAAPDRFLLGLAVLTLLSEAADEAPLVCVVDDAHWLDRASEQCLSFVSRRLLAERVALVFGVRDPIGERELSGLPDLPLRGLAAGDARALLASTFPGRLDVQVRDRILSEAHGNPLALLELPKFLTPAEQAGGFGVSDAQPLASRLEQSFLERTAALPEETQRLLLVAAAEPVGDVTLLWRAAPLLGIGQEAGAAAETAGLIEFGVGVKFRHPLVRSAVYRAATREERRRVHRALADATDVNVDPDRRAWHLAQAAGAPDETVAVELERSAERAQRRGGAAAAGAFLARAAELTPGPARRGARALAAAEAEIQAGAFDAAMPLLGLAEATTLEDAERARVDLLRGRLAFLTDRGSDAPPLLLKSAQALSALDPDLARETYLEALSAAMYAARFGGRWDQRRVGEAVLAARSGGDRARPSGLLLDGLAVLMTSGHAAAAPLLRRAIEAIQAGDLSADEAAPWLWLPGVAAWILWDDETLDRLSLRLIELARDAGALGVVSLVLNQRATLSVMRGDFGAAALLLEELTGIAEVTRGHVPPYASIALAAMRGREREASEVFGAHERAALHRGEGAALTCLQWARATLLNSLGRYEDAVTVAQPSPDDRHEHRFSAWLAVELIEAATRSGDPDKAAEAMERVSQTTQASGTEWALGIEARSRALISDGEAADALYREGIERLGRTSMRTQLARGHLIYGEWLRRETRRADARTHLRAAHEQFTSIGMEAFAERARRELLATGEKARKRTVETRDDLTAQERQIAGLAREGFSSREIAARLFLSPRTVEWHLRKVFNKLGIHSRRQLATALASSESEAVPG